VRKEKQEHKEKQVPEVLVEPEAILVILELKV
jgi:hypothetical protein